MDQVFRRLQTDEAAADDHRAPRRLDHLHARVRVDPQQKSRAALDPLTDLGRAMLTAVFRIKALPR
jgi:hypothetical protein